MLSLIGPSDLRAMTAHGPTMPGTLFSPDNSWRLMAKVIRSTAWKMDENRNRSEEAQRLATRSASASRWDLRRTIRRPELRKIVPLADTTIYELEQRGEFPKRFNLTPRCVVWDLDEVQGWVDQRRQDASAGGATRASGPDVHQRRTRPVKAPDRA